MIEEHGEYDDTEEVFEVEAVDSFHREKQRRTHNQGQSRGQNQGCYQGQRYNQGDNQGEDDNDVQGQYQVQNQYCQYLVVRSLLNITEILDHIPVL